MAEISTRCVKCNDILVRRGFISSHDLRSNIASRRWMMAGCILEEPVKRWTEA